MEELHFSMLGPFVMFLSGGSLAGLAVAHYLEFWSLPKSDNTRIIKLFSAGLFALLFLSVLMIIFV